MRLYIHWPFCLSRCSYCDFNSRVAGSACMERYRTALLREMEAWACLLEEGEKTLLSIYLGGGTPSTMSGSEVCALLDKVYGCFVPHESAEVTVEVNPATWRREDFAEACAGGANRFSVGVQALDDLTLRMLKRAHDADDAKRAVMYALCCEPASVSIDLMFGLPGMDTPGLESCLDEILELGPHHISLYALSLTGVSQLGRAVSAGTISLPEEEEVARQYLSSSERLCSAGYEHYEVSNFCLPGHRGRHNSGYWERDQYLGVGAGAHSMLGKCRLRNTDSVLAYMRMSERRGLAVEDCELLSVADELEEAIILGLRTSSGVPESMLGEKICRLDDFEAGGFLTRKDGCLHLTPRGMLVSNDLISSLLPA
jgi:oxygen-independent coproporphyrinogen III oxidase